MGQYRKNGGQANASRVLNLAKDLVGKDGGFYGYSPAEASRDAGEEHRYELPLHANQRLPE
ncbi:hypothetical protein F2S72_08755 [Pseudomonas syringae pv. actinidiae]|nr:hypothetical protein [Pseudomonas syringae pv. actinidiae]